MITERARNRRLRCSVLSNFLVEARICRENSNVGVKRDNLTRDDVFGQAGGQPKFIAGGWCGGMTGDR